MRSLAKAWRLVTQLKLSMCETRACLAGRDGVSESLTVCKNCGNQGGGKRLVPDLGDKNGGLRVIGIRVLAPSKMSV